MGSLGVTSVQNKQNISFKFLLISKYGHYHHQESEFPDQKNSSVQ